MGKLLLAEGAVVALGGSAAAAFDGIELHATVQIDDTIVSAGNVTIV